ARGNRRCTPRNCQRDRSSAGIWQMTDEDIRNAVECAHVEELLEPESPPFSHDALALDFTKAHGSRLIYVHAWRTWLLNDGMRWQREATLLVPDMVRRFLREVAEQ